VAETSTPAEATMSPLSFWTLASAGMIATMMNVDVDTLQPVRNQPPGKGCPCVQKSPADRASL
jgi:hypothetical protein